MPSRTALEQAIEGMLQRYNGDNDLIPGAPVVTWADRELLYMIQNLLKEITAQGNEIHEINVNLALKSEIIDSQRRALEFSNMQIDRLADRIGRLEEETAALRTEGNVIMRDLNSLHEIAEGLETDCSETKLNQTVTEILKRHGE